MSRDPRILDDIAKVAGGAVNILSGVQQQIRDDVKARVEEMADRLDLVPRSDLDQALMRISALEKRLDEIETKPAAKKTKKTASKKTSNKQT